jgi:hypothetical protein
MTIDWNKFQNELDQMVDEAGDKTDKRLAHKISSITRLTEVEVKQLFPDPGDVKRLGELIEIIRRAGDRKDKINTIVSNAGKFGGIILTLLDKLV